MPWWKVYQHLRDIPGGGREPTVCGGATRVPLEPLSLRRGIAFDALSYVKPDRCAQTHFRNGRAQEFANALEEADPRED